MQTWYEVDPSVDFNIFEIEDIKNVGNKHVTLTVDRHVIYFNILDSTTSIQLKRTPTPLLYRIYIKRYLD